MKITRKDVEYVAALAHLELAAEEIEQMREQLDSILGYVDKLSELDTDKVEPMAQVLAPTGPGQAQTHPEAAWRDDAPRASLNRADALAAAPDAQEPFVKVPKVIER